jgi:hypothetical protein
MSKASQLVRGYLQTKIVPLPLAGVRGQSLLDGPHPDGEPGGTTPGPVAVGLKPLPPWDEAEIRARALEYAKSHGIENPAEDGEVVEFGKAIYRCLIGVVDAESDPHSPLPFFDGGIEQIERMTELGRDGVLTLSRMHETYQDEVGGQIEDWGEDGLKAAAEELAGPRGGFFWFALRPGMQLSYALFSARLLLSLLEDKSTSGSGSVAADPSTGSSPKRSEPAQRTRGRK